jgi:hypothetical protein
MLDNLEAKKNMNAKKTEERKVFKSRLYLSTHSSIWKSKTGSVGFENQHVLDYSVEETSWSGACLNHVHPELILDYMVFNIFWDVFNGVSCEFYSCCTLMQ